MRACTLLACGIALIMSALLIAGCSSESAVAPPTPPTNGEPTLSAFQSDQELEDHLKRGIVAQTQPVDDLVGVGGGGSGGGDIGSPPPPAADVDAGAGDSFSDTNLQEAGVDEADRAKTDGRYLYLIERTDPRPVPLFSTASVSHRVRVMEFLSDPERAQEIAAVPLDVESLDKAYLLTEREAGQPDVLVVLGSAFGGFFGGDWFRPWSWRSGRTDVRIVDVSAPQQPLVTHRLELDGSLISSRRIGEILYLATRHAPSIPGHVPFPVSAEDETNNAQAIAAARLSDLMPGWTPDGTTSRPAVKSTECFLPPSEDRIDSPDVITVVAIDLRKPQDLLASRCIVGSSEAMYVSNSAIYLATTRYGYPRIAVDGLVQYQTTVNTDVHKFALNGKGIEYRGSGTVQGHLGWEQDKKSFRMGEHDGVLRIATSTGAFWNGEPDTQVTLLREGRTGTGLLEVIATLPNSRRPEQIGSPGERLFAARFIGDRGYLVTFRQIDPLYVLDLSDPLDPVIAGSLKIPGYSDYLHPVGEHLILGIGKDALAADNTPGDGRGAWVQGVKVALFDATDPADPREVDSEIIGKRGTEADVLRDHHGFAFLAHDDGSATPSRLALPVQVHETLDNPGIPVEPSTHYGWTHSGLYLYDIHDGSLAPPAIEPAGRVIVDSADTNPFSGSSLGLNRAVIRGDGVHLIQGNAVWSAQWDNPDIVQGPQ